VQRWRAIPGPRSTCIERCPRLGELPIGRPRTVEPIRRVDPSGGGRTLNGEHPGSARGSGLRGGPWIASHVATLALASLYAWGNLSLFGRPRGWYLLTELPLVACVFCLLQLARLAAARARARHVAVSLVLASVLFTLILVDLYVVFLCYDTSGAGGYVISHKNWRDRYVTTNALGYWERDISSLYRTSRSGSAEGGPVLAFVGDSFTWGQGVRGKQHRFTEVLQAMLADRRVEVVNFGKGGADTTQELEIRSLVAAVRAISARPVFVLLPFPSSLGRRHES